MKVLLVLTLCALMCLSLAGPPSGDKTNNGDKGGDKNSGCDKNEIKYNGPQQRHHGGACPHDPIYDSCDINDKPDKTGECVPGCYCKIDFKRADNGKCKKQ